MHRQSQASQVNDSQRELYFNGHLVETYKDLIKHISLMPFQEAVERMQ